MDAAKIFVIVLTLITFGALAWIEIVSRRNARLAERSKSIEPEVVEINKRRA